MKPSLPALLLCGLLGACAIAPPQPTDTSAAAGAAPATTGPQTADGNACLGSTDLPPALADAFEAVDDPTLLASSLGAPGAGALCQGKVYRSKATSKITLYRSWNSTNPNSRIGNWWAFDRPEGSVADYRSENEICYQWSPLDMLVTCTLLPGVSLVVGNGQSATCSQYLSYPVSASQQVYIDHPQAAVADCETAAGDFSWR